MASVLLVHENAVLRTTLEAMVRQELGDAAPVVALEAYGADAAAAAAAADAALLGTTAPARRGGAPHHGTHKALKAFLSDALAKRAQLPLVLLATAGDAELAAMLQAQAVQRIVLLKPGSAWLQEARESLRLALGLRPGSVIDTRRTRTVLRIFMTDASKGRWHLERRGQAGDPSTGPLEMDRIHVKEICDKVRNLPQDMRTRAWADCVPPVANELYRALFGPAKNEPLRKAFEDVLASTDLARVRMVFGLPGESSMLPVETLKRYGEARNCDQWYSLHAPILRQYQGSDEPKPLFRDAASRSERVDCLLVAADPRGNRETNVAALDHVPLEVAQIARALRTARRAGANVGLVVTLRLGRHPDKTPTQRLGEVLARRRWRLVHFAGHSHVELDDKGQVEGYLLLSAAQREQVNFSDFVAYVPGAQFLFASSCGSADPAFLQRAMQESIPAVLGYLWPVDDSEARSLSVHFYQALFTPGGEAYQSLARALAQARSRMFRLQAVGAIWASAVLLAKGTDAAWCEAHAAQNPSSASKVGTP
jgi:CHAT domain-containing protein